MKINISNLDTEKRNFWKMFKNKMNVSRNVNDKTISIVKNIIKSVRKNGDKSLLRFINKYDGYKTSNLKSIRVTKKEIRDKTTRITDMPIHSFDREKKFHDVFFGTSFKRIIKPLLLWAAAAQTT